MGASGWFLNFPNSKRDECQPQCSPRCRTVLYIPRLKTLRPGAKCQSQMIDSQPFRIALRKHLQVQVKEIPEKKEVAGKWEEQQMFLTTSCDVRNSDSDAVCGRARHCLLPRSLPHFQHRQHLCGNMSQRPFGCKLSASFSKLYFPA